MTSLVDKLVPDDLWAIVEPLLPPPPRPPHGGRRRTIGDRTASPRWCSWPAPLPMATPARAGAWLRLASDRLAPAGSVGQGWRVRPTQPGDPGPTRARWPAGLVTCQRGLGQRARQAWGDHVGANPVDRGKPGSKLHLVSERHGLPLTVAITAANAGDTSVFAALLDDVPAVLTPARRRRSRPGKLDADKAYDSAANRAYLRRRGIKARIARRGIESSRRLGRQRWRIERTLSWLSCYRRLAVRWDQDSERWFAFVLLACALVCFNRL
jgi:transposase